MFLGVAWVGGGDDGQWGSTVEPLYRGHHRTQLAVLQRGVCLIQEYIYTQLYVVGTADTVLIREMSFIQSDFCREVPLYVCGIVILMSVA